MPNPPNTPVLQQFMQQIAPLAQRMGIKTLIVAGKDPQTGEDAFFSSPESMEALRDFVEHKFVEKLGLPGETAWNDV